MPPETQTGQIGQEKDKKPTIREISAGIVVFRRTPEGPKFLILYHGGNYWNFPKGKIEKEEGDLAAALRETKEEMGLNPRDLRVVRNFKAYERFSFRRDGNGIFKIVIFYLAETHVVHDIKISDYHQGYGWFSYREASKLFAKHRDSQKVLRQAFEFLGGAAKNPSSIRGGERERTPASKTPPPQPRSSSSQAQRPQPQRIYRPQTAH